MEQGVFRSIQKSDTTREATSDEVVDLNKEKQRLKKVIADLVYAEKL